MFAGMNPAGKPLALAGRRDLNRLDKRDGRLASIDEVPVSLNQPSLIVVKNVHDIVVDVDEGWCSYGGNSPIHPCMTRLR